MHKQTCFTFYGKTHNHKVLLYEENLKVNDSNFPPKACEHELHI
jgi:hypothetical protein